MKSRINQGFTLMEIMVVIIVIAVLSSVAGPIINGVVDQAKASATRTTMMNIKSGLVNFNNDLGKFPFTGVAQTAASFNSADSEALSQDFTKNVLVNGAVAGLTLGMASDTFSRRWKGPYMDSDPSMFMTDPWESKIRYRYNGKQLYLHSFGPDGIDDFPNAIASGEYEGDDIVFAVSRVK
jgi:prepilin-type N-terminal cleavage/methylation domain-containing protein